VLTRKKYMRKPDSLQAQVDTLSATEAKQRGQRLAQQEQVVFARTKHPLAKRLLRCFLYLTVLSSQAACTPKKLNTYHQYENLSHRPTAVEVDKVTDRKAQQYVRLAQSQPELALKLFSEYKKEPFAKDILLELYKKDPLNTAMHYGEIQHESYANDVFVQWLSGSDPSSFLMVLEGAHPEIATKILEQAILSSPTKIMSSISDNATTGIILLLEKSTNPTIKSGVAFFQEKGSHWSEPRYTKTLHSIIHDHAPYAIQKDVYPTDTILASLISDYKHLNSTVRERAQKELEDYASVIGGRIDEAHEAPDAMRFEEIKKMNADQLYLLMVLNDDVVYTSSFNGIFNQFLEELSSEHMPLQVFLSHYSTHDTRTFIKLCATFGHLNDVFSKTDVESTKDLSSQLVSGLEYTQKQLSDIANVGETLSFLTNPEQINIFLNDIKKEYARAAVSQNHETLRIYGTLASVLKQKNIVSDSFVTEMAARYPLPSYDALEPKQLYDASDTNIQRYYFPADEDGQASFDHFVATYNKNLQWVISDHTTYICISSIDTPKHVVMYANKPNHEQKGQEDIQSVFSQKNTKAHIEVPRGHSYNTEETIKHLSVDTSIVFLGSCGGFRTLSHVLDRVPNAHTLSTRGMGAMAVNDEILYQMNSVIAQGKPFSWEAIAAASKKRIGTNKNYSDYVYPNKNISLSLLNSLNASHTL